MRVSGSPLESHRHNQRVILASGVDFGEGIRSVATRDQGEAGLQGGAEVLWRESVGRDNQVAER